MADATADSGSDGLLRPWQFFLLAGMLGATATVIVATGQSPASIVTLSLTVVAAGLAGLGLYHTLVPLVSPESVDAPSLVGGRTRVALEREKVLVLRSIKELEFDRAMGKVAQTDFDDMASRLRSRALGLIQQLQDGDGYRTLIERELQTRLSAEGAPPTVPSAGADEGDVLPAVAEAPDARAQACAACGVENDADARFCKGCGTRIGPA